MQLNPARGRKPDYLGLVPYVTHFRFMQLNPARGRKLPSLWFGMVWYGLGFMQLNPARGRKQTKGLFEYQGEILIEVYAAQPREGTETLDCQKC